MILLMIKLRKFQILIKLKKLYIAITSQAIAFTLSLGSSVILEYLVIYQSDDC